MPAVLEDVMPQQPIDDRQPRTPRRRSRAVAGAVAVATGLAGFAAGWIVADDSAELSAVQEQLAAAQIQDTSREEALDDQEAALAEQEEALASRQAELDERDAALAEREAAVDEREAAVDDPSGTTAGSAGPSRSAGGSSSTSGSSAATTGSTTSASSFDRDRAVAKAGDVRDDIAALDEYTADGDWASSSTRLGMLADSYARVASAGIPDGVDAAEYAARLATLEEFALLAADEIRAYPTDGAARYQVIRQRTGSLFDTLNAAIGSTLALP